MLFCKYDSSLVLGEWFWMKRSYKVRKWCCLRSTQPESVRGVFMIGRYSEYSKDWEWFDNISKSEVVFCDGFESDIQLRMSLSDMPRRSATCGMKYLQSHIRSSRDAQ